MLRILWNHPWVYALAKALGTSFPFKRVTCVTLANIPPKVLLGGGRVTQQHTSGGDVEGGLVTLAKL